jgi:hypothetical protein
MTISPQALKQLRLTMKSLGCVETTSEKMEKGNLRFNDPTIRARHTDYIIYAKTGVVRRYLSHGGYWQSWGPLNGKNRDYTKNPGTSIQPAENEAELLLIAVRGVINYRNG